MSTHKGTSAKEKTKTRRRTGKRAEPQNLTNEVAPSNLTTQAETVEDRIRRELATNPLDAALPVYDVDPLTAEDREKWRREGEYFARLLYHPDTPKAFAEAFDALYAGTLLERGGVNITDPRILRHAHAGIMEDLHHSIPADADAITAGILAVAWMLIPEGVREPIRAAVYGRLPHEETAAELERLLAGDSLTREQHRMLTAAVDQLANDTHAHTDHPAIVRHFYNVAAPLASPDSEGLGAVAEVLRLIREGETFADYVNHDDLGSWRARREDAQKGGVG